MGALLGVAVGIESLRKLFQAGFFFPWLWFTRSVMRLQRVCSWISDSDTLRSLLTPTLVSFTLGTYVKSKAVGGHSHNRYSTHRALTVSGSILGFWYISGNKKQRLLPHAAYSPNNLWTACYLVLRANKSEEDSVPWVSSGENRNWVLWEITKGELRSGMKFKHILH